jgi:hypothetical protein
MERRHATAEGGTVRDAARLPPPHAEDAKQQARALRASHERTKHRQAAVKPGTSGRSARRPTPPCAKRSKQPHAVRVRGNQPSTPSLGTQRAAALRP